MKIIRPFKISDVSLVSSTVSPVDDLAATFARTIIASSVANPTVLTFSAVHNLAVGARVALSITGSNSTPTTNGNHLGIVTATDKISVPVNVTVAGTAGTATIAAWSSTQGYSVGAIQQVDPQSVSLTVTANDKRFTTSTAHYFLTGCSGYLTGTLPTGFSADTLYYVVDGANASTLATKTTFSLSLTKNGAPILPTTTGTGVSFVCTSYGVVNSVGGYDFHNAHRIYECLVTVTAGTNLEPRKDAVSWFDLGSTNRFKAFDDTITSQVENVASMTYVVQCKGRIDGLALFNVSGAEVTITGETTADGVVYGPTTYSLISHVEASSYWDWFFSPIERKATFIDIDFPPYLNLKMTVTITGGTASEIVKCGAFILGLSKDFGDTLNGASVGIVDYSRNVTDDNGNVSIREGKFADRGSFTVLVPRVAHDSMKAELAKYRATPIVYVASEAYDSTAFFGRFKSFDLGIEYDTYSICTIEIESL